MKCYYNLLFGGECPEDNLQHIAHHVHHILRKKKISVKPISKDNPLAS